ncbi:hypothetical protein N658DRAFT_491372 [Parathielavia hyrcaniae]|uniref:Uncharacterized protein n=1 Tax=Parathielavia hyrcaniae TaxID=113614 RepID=A0AAN6QAP1_9PEZI|nr:hypothetical protein N658DRAFT_491372 [Parathielavia hyrcaniae]
MSAPAVAESTLLSRMSNGTAAANYEADGSSSMLTASINGWTVSTVWRCSAAVVSIFPHMVPHSPRCLALIRKVVGNASPIPGRCLPACGGKRRSRRRGTRGTVAQPSRDRTYRCAAYLKSLPRRHDRPPSRPPLPVVTSFPLTSRPRHVRIAVGEGRHHRRQH